MKRTASFKAGIALCTAFILLVTSFHAICQNSFVNGKVINSKKEPLSDATVRVKNANTATKTNEQGVFNFQHISGHNIILIVSHIGYQTKEVVYSGGAEITIVLTETASVEDEIVITGVFDKRKKLEASVAITTISLAQINKITPVSTADLLKNVPGVYVNSSLGEVRNTVYSRGVSVGSNDGASGYYYVSMQEDGLPVSNVTYNNFGPDYFTRADATLGKLEAVRGGTASILGANAPGGIFNYIMKEGGPKTSGEIRTKYGKEGNGKNDFYRTDFNIGGPLGKYWYYDVGGFYRYAQGARFPGYALNNGGQFRGNVIKKYNTGTIKVYAKYLNDHNGWFEFTPTVGFTDPKPTAGFDENSSVLIPKVRQQFAINSGANGTDIYSSDDLIHSKERSIGATWEQRLGKGWTFNNAVRYSDKSTRWNTTGVVYPLAFDDLVTYAILGMLGSPGTYSFRSTNTGNELMSITSYSGYDFNVNHSDLPGQNVSKNSLFLEPLLYKTNNVKELLDQFSFTKRLKDMSFTVGGFIGRSNIDRKDGSAGAGFGTIQNRPELVTMTLTDFSGKISHITNSSGLTIGGTTTLNHATQKQAAFFFGHNWQISSALNLDWGVRYEAIRVKGYNSLGVTTQSTTGGLDGDALTLYDNSIGSTPNTYSFNKDVATFSYSAGLNYKINNHFALYGRYSEGNKAPDLDVYFSATTDFISKTLNPEAQKVRQAEMGVKVKTGNLDLFVTPFYSILSNVPNVQIFQNLDQTSYNPPTNYIKLRTYGLEVEANYSFAKHFSVRGVATLQRSKAIDYNVWIAKDFGPADDSLVSYSGNESDNLARTMINITPAYNINKFYAQLTWSFMGKRQANVANAFLLPSFSQFNFSTGYEVARNLQLALTINNLLNKYGVMSWSRPGTLLTAIDRQGFTKEMYEQAVANNTPYSSISIPARAYYLSATFSF
jgi:iron complex outermembrane recepter protein